MLRVGVGFGSNLGDRLRNLRRARELTLALPAIIGETLNAPLYETDPVGCPPDADPFLNSVLEVGIPSDKPPAAFLAELRAIEKSLGRASRAPRNASRPVDLDLLYASDLIENSPALTLPHPRLHQRRFVLAPLAAIRPNLILPNQHRSVLELLYALDDRNEVREIAGDW